MLVIVISVELVCGTLCVIGRQRRRAVAGMDHGGGLVEGHGQGGAACRCPRAARRASHSARYSFLGERFGGRRWRGAPRS